MHSYGEDYDFLPLDSTITVFGAPNQNICTPVETLLDRRIEDTERFTVQLNTSDTNVVIFRREAEILLTDSDGNIILVVL